MYIILCSPQPPETYYSYNAVFVNSDYSDHFSTIVQYDFTFDTK